MNLAISTAVFIVLLCIIEALFLFLKNRSDPEKERVRRQLRIVKEAGTIEQPGITVRKRMVSNIPLINRLLMAIPGIAGLDRLLVQADSSRSVGSLLSFSLVLSVSAFFVAYVFSRNEILGVLSFAAGGVVPFVNMWIKKTQRMKKFEGQLPDALDLIARSLRAGHALSGALQMVSQEFDYPIGTEFQRTVTQINYGVGVEHALKNMTERIDCPDLKFLAVSIIIQRESGGNLAEILESIAGLIRERFKLRGKVRALSAEGRISAVILTGIPFCVAAVLFVTNPAYLAVLFSDPIGKMLVGVALVMMASGTALIKKMVAIKI